MGRSTEFISFINSLNIYKEKDLYNYITIEKNYEIKNARKLYRKNIKHLKEDISG
jgi:hypothetical protein